MEVPPAAESARCLADLPMITLAIPCLAEPFEPKPGTCRTSLFAREEPARILRHPAVLLAAGAPRHGSALTKSIRTIFFATIADCDWIRLTSLDCTLGEATERNPGIATVQRCFYDLAKF